MANHISPRINKIVNVIFSLGAAVVIIATLAKILHLAWADYALIVGFITEAGIFIIYAFLPPPESGSEATHAGPAHGATDEVISHMEAAKLDGAAFEKLSTSFSRLNDTAMYLGDLADMSKASKDFTHNTASAAVSLGTIKDAVAGVAVNLGSFSTATEGVKDMNAQFQTISKSLESMNQYYSKLNEASAAMSSSAADAVRAKEQIALLADNLTQLNKVYGNMINAMQGR
jgi:gliding motility-associated protein GldL